jgi:outer membrane protein
MNIKDLVNIYNKKYQGFIFIFLAIVLTSSTVSAQNILTLEQAISEALEYNYAIRIEKKQYEIADNNVFIGNAGMLPRIDVLRSTTYNYQDIGFKVGRGDSSFKNVGTTTTYGFDLGWTIFDGAAMFINYDKLKHLRSLSHIELQMTIENTLLELISTYYNLVGIKKNLTSAYENLDLSRQRLKRAELRFEYGAIQSVQLLQAKVDFSTDSSEYLLAELSYSSQKRAINFLLGKSSDIDFEIDTSFTFIKLAQYDELKEQMTEQNSMLNYAIKNKEISEYDRRIIIASMIPRFTVNAGYRFSEQNLEVGFFNSSKATGFNVGLNGQMNLFDGFRTTRNLQNAVIRSEISDIAIEQTRSQIEISLKNYYDIYLRRQEILMLEQSNIEFAEANFRRSTELYDLAQITATELRQAQINLLFARNRITNAQVQLKIAETQLMLLTGGLIE